MLRSTPIAHKAKSNKPKKRHHGLFSKLRKSFTIKQSPHSKQLQYFTTTNNNTGHNNNNKNDGNTRQRDRPQQDDQFQPQPQSQPHQQQHHLQEQQPEQPKKEIFKTGNTARLKEDVAVDTSVTREHLARFAHLLGVNSPDSHGGRFIYNTSAGAHPALTFALYPNPLTNENQYETAFHANKIYPRYSYDTELDGSLEHIRGVHYLPQYGKQHLLSQGRIETFHPLLLNHPLQYIIQAGLANGVDKREKHRDRVEIDGDGKLMGLHPQKTRNEYYTAVERNQIQTRDGKLCVDYQVQHLFYNDDNNIIVTRHEQTQRQRLEQIYESLQEAKAQDLLDELRELTLRTNIEILPQKSQSTRSQQLQLQEDKMKIQQLRNDIDDLGGKPSTQQRYYDLVHNNVKIRKSDLFSFLTFTSNNNKLAFNDRYAGYHGHDGIVVPMEYLATLALQELVNFVPQFAPSEPQIWKDVRHEAIVLEQEHMRDELMNEKILKWKAYDKWRKQLKKHKQDVKYEELYRKHQQQTQDLMEKDQKRKDGELKGLMGAVHDSRKSFMQKEKYDKLPLPEEIEVSEDNDEGRDYEFDVFTNETEVTLNQDEIQYIKDKTTPPPWHTTFQSMRRYEFRSLTPLTIKTPRRSSIWSGEGDEPRLDSQYIELNFYARLIEDSFDYRSYEHLLTGALNEFDLQLKQVRAGLIKEEALDLGKMISFSDICRDKPLEIEVWFEIPTEYDEIKARAERLRVSDPRSRPTTGTRCFTGIVTYDAPGSFHFMGLSEDQMKRLFALRQGITITRM